MNSVENGDVVTVVYYKVHSNRNCKALVGRQDKITVRKEGVYKSGEKCCMINGDRWSHKEVNNNVHKEGVIYDHFRVVVKVPEDLPRVLEEVKTIVQESKDSLHKELREVVLSLEHETSWDIKYRDLD